MSKFTVHLQAICQTTNIGNGSSIGAFSYIPVTCKLGENCQIYNNVTLADNVSISTGVSVGAGCNLGADVSIEANANIDTNATVYQGVKIGMFASIAAGSVITENIPPHAQVSGNPARVNNFNSQKTEDYFIKTLDELNDRIDLDVGDCQLWSLQNITDARGSLVVTEFSQHLPFVPQRCFYILSVPPENNIRGLHAHKVCQQFLVVLNGSVNFVIDDGNTRREISINQANKGLYMPTGIWGVQYKFSPDAVLAVFASQPYSEANYLREYQDYLKYVRGN